MAKVYFLGISLCFLVFLLARGYFAYKDIAEGKKDVFYMTAFLLYKRGLLWQNKKKNKNITVKDMAPILSALNPGTDIKTVKTEYMVGKIRLGLIIFLSGNVLAFAVCLGSMNSGMLIEGNAIRRNSYTEVGKTAELTVKSIGLPFEEEFSLTIAPQKYSEEQLCELYKGATKELTTRIRGKNLSLSHVETDLELPKNIEGYPFTLAWESSDYNVLSPEGAIRSANIPREGSLVTLTCTFSYEKWTEIFEFPIKIYPKTLSEDEIWKEKIIEKLEEYDSKTSTLDVYILPSQADDTDLVWTENKNNSSLEIYLLIGVLAVMVFFLKDYDMEKQMKSRTIQLSDDYFSIVNSLTLYMAAGMSTKTAFIKIAEDYKAGMEKKGAPKYAYEEMYVTCNEMKNGISEVKAYENFAKRCAGNEYTRLAGLLSQNIRKGNAELLSEMKKETFNARIEKQNKIRKKGEEAGTKLLLPMMLLLGVVMAMIMIPAMMSFTL